MKNYQILPNNYADAEQGFEIQDPNYTFISWNTPVQEVLKKHRHLLKVDVYKPFEFCEFSLSGESWQYDFKKFGNAIFH